MSLIKVSKKHHHAVTLLAVSAILAACGGGGDGAPTVSKASAADEPTVPTLSANQQAFEEFLLSPGEGSYLLHWFMPRSGSGINNYNYIFSDYSVIPASPLTNGPQTSTQSASLNLTSTLALVSIYPTRVLKNGAVLVVPFGVTNTVSYVGENVRIDALASDGVTVAYSAIRSEYETVSLSGPISSTPVDLSHFLGVILSNPAILDSSASYAAGAKYIKFKKTNLGDRYNAGDCGAATTGANISPCRTGTTLINTMTAGQRSNSDGATYYLADGAIRTVDGVSIWVANNPRPISATNSGTVQYRIYFELNGNVYTGSLVKDGTVLADTSYVATTSPEFLAYDIRLNKAAHDSLKAAMKL